MRMMPLNAIEAIAITEDADIIIKRLERQNKIPVIRKKIRNPEKKQEIVNVVKK
jgi:hypothetical protein